MKRLLIWSSPALAVLASLIVLYAWEDPMQARVRSRYPSAKIEDWGPEHIPPVFHSRYGHFQDEYLGIEITRRDVNLNDFRDIPFKWLTLKRCKLSDLTPVPELSHHLFRALDFIDCDMTAVPPSQRPGTQDPAHATYHIGGP